MTAQEPTDVLSLADYRAIREDFRRQAHRAGECRRGCCWNPFGVCGVKRSCNCHTWHSPAEPLYFPTARPREAFSTSTEDGAQEAA